MRWLVPSLACLALAAGEPLTATPWDVRKDAGELLDEITRASADPAELLARAQTLMLEHGHELITTAPNEAAPIAHALTVRLTAAGLAERFAAGLAPAAERRATELLARGGDASAWAGLARSIPGTPAAARAWRRAADLAWDHGLLRLYHDVASSAGEREAAGRKERYAAAAALLVAPVQALPASLDGLDTMWSIAVERATPAPPAPGRRRNRVVGPNLGRPGATAFGDGAVALADGQSMQVIDHLVGTSLGSGIALGTRPLPSHLARPEAVPGGAVAIGLADGRLVLACADAAGSERWRHTSDADGIDSIGAPLAIDGLIAVPYRVVGEDRMELRILAVDARDGRPMWDSPVGQLTTPGWGGDNVAAPSLARHARGMVVCSNAGLFALVGSDGGVRRLWTYPIRPDIEIDGARRGRRGLAAGDGSTAVATPADHAGLVLVLGPEDATPRAYRGDGADGDVLAVQGGDALLAGRQVVLIDTVRLRLRWSAPLRLPEPQGMLAVGSALVAGNDQLALLARQDGTMRSGRALGQPAAVATGDGVLVLAERETIRGFGDAGAFLARLREAASTSGNDPRPHTALGAVLAGRGDTAGALAAWRTALSLGAGPAIAERVARLLRTRMLQAADPVEAAAALDQLAALAPQLPGMTDELRLWRGRMAEQSGDRIAATAHFTAVLAATDRLLPLPDGISVSLRLLAEAGLARTGGRPWVPLAAPIPLVDPGAGAWSVSARVRGRAVISGRQVCAFADGLLRTWNLADGSDAWVRKPQRSLLGVQPWNEPAADGVAIRVMAGSAGDAAGLRDGDVLLSLNGEPLRDFEADLRPRVLALGGGTPFTFRVRSIDGALREVQGRFGGEPLEPLASDGDIILARTTMNLAPGRGDLRVFAIDAATGKDLWAHALSHDEDRLARTIPVLVGGVTVAADGSDLVGIGRDGVVRWRLANRADLLAQARAIGRCLWLPGGSGEAVLLDPSDGRELARLPASGDEPPVIASTTLAARCPDGRVSLWDIAAGRLLGRSADPARVLALRAEGLLALDGRGRPVVLDTRNGAVRRVLVDAPAEMSAIGASNAFLTLAGAERRSICAVALDGLVQRWSLELPPGLEVESLRPTRDGVLAILRESTRSWGLSLDARGVPVAVAGWASDPGGDATPLGDAVLVVEAKNVRVVRPGLAKPPPPVRCTVLDQAKPLRQAAAAGTPAWSQPSGAALAVARHGIHLVIAVRTAGAEHVLRLGDAGGTISLDTVRAMIAPGGLRLAIPGAWTLAEQWTTPDPGGPIVWSAWAPLPSRAPGSPVAVLLDEHADQPWWLAGGWLNVLDPP